MRVTIALRFYRTYLGYASPLLTPCFGFPSVRFCIASPFDTVGSYVVVRGTGQWRSVPVNVLELDGERYLVTPRGETHWVRNLRAAGGGEIEYGRRRTQPFTAIEVPDEEKPRVIAAYLDRWGNQVRSQFEALPDPADHPVFRIKAGEA